MDSIHGEDNLLERKVESDVKDVLKTMVAFANSVKPGQTATLLIGETDDGFAQGLRSPAGTMKYVRDQACKIYPPLKKWSAFEYEKDGRTCIRVEINWDGETPHFGGPAWVRTGSSSVEASEQVFQELIDLRSPKLWKFKQLLNTAVSVEGVRSNAAYMHPHWDGIREAWVHAVDSVRVSLKCGQVVRSEPLELLVLSYDDANHRPKIMVYDCAPPPTGRSGPT